MRVSVKSLTIGATSYIGLLAGGYWWALSKREEAAKEELAKLAEDAQGRPKAFSEAERLSVFGKGAGAYDKEIGTDETVMGLNLLRWWLLSKARGAVLEVAGGTGRNLDYLVPGKGDVASLTIVDLCHSMVAQLEHKLKTRCVHACVRWGVFGLCWCRAGLCSTWFDFHLLESCVAPCTTASQCVVSQFRSLHSIMNHRHHRRRADVTFGVMDVQRMTFPNRSFDTVVRSNMDPDTDPWF